MSISERLITKLQDPSTLRLMMGELDGEELLIAQAAVRYTIAQLKEAGIINISNLIVWELQQKPNDTVTFDVEPQAGKSQC